MFTDAAGMFYGLHCTVCGRVQGGAPVVHGLGCLISPSHIVTARHVWREVGQKYGDPVVLKHDGLYRCDIEAEHADADVVLLKVSTRIDPGHSANPPARYPKVHQTPPSWGMSVGFLARMSAGREVRAAFSLASVSFLDFSGEAGRPKFWGLSGGIIQKGAIGGPVFTVEGDLLGLIVDSYPFKPDLDHPESPVIPVPVMSPLWPFRDQVEKIQRSVEG